MGIDIEDVLETLKQLKEDIERTNIEEVLREVALKLTEYEAKVRDLEHALDLKEKALSRQLGLT